MSTSDEDLGLLAAGFTAMLGFQVVPPRQRQQSVRPEATSFLSRLSTGLSSVFGGMSLEGATSEPIRPKIGIHELFHTTYHPFQPSLHPQPQSGVILESADTDVLNINVKMINGGTTAVRARRGQTVKEVKAAIARQFDIPEVPKLTLFGQPLLDSNPIGMYMPVPTQLPQPGIQYEALMPLPPPGVPMFMSGPPALGGGVPVISCCAGSEEPYELDCSGLDPPFDYDFTNKEDDNKKYIRGGKEYQRPYGWKRFAVKVLGQYDNNTWLGEKGIRTEESKGEWPVSYHGSGNRKAVDGILDKGYKIGKGNMYGDGVYTSPSIKWYGEKSNRYTAKFEYKGDRWMVILQNRVNPSESDGHLKIQEKTWAGVPFWISPLQDIDKKVFDVRPYGVLFKKM